jgi:hypothetical protein
MILGDVVAASKRHQQFALGFNAQGSDPVCTGFSNGRIYASKFTLSQAGTMIELHGWFSHSTFVGGTARVVIYADSAGSPAARLAYTGSYNVTAIGATEIAEAGFSVALTPADYWIGFISQVTSGNPSCYGDDTGGTHKGLTLGATYTPPPDPFPSPDTSGTRKHSCWAVLV